MIHFWENLTSPQIGEIKKETAMVLFPIAATEQHSAHLPVGTDSIILRGLLKDFADNASFPEGDLLIAPQLCVGKSNEHMEFPGTITFTAKTLYDTLFEMTRSIAAHGFRRLVFVNSHGGNTDMLNLISRDIRIELGMDVYVFDWWFTDFWQDLLKTEKKSDSIYGVFHACELETSLMLRLAPELVHMDLAKDDTPDEQFKDNQYLSLFGPITMGWKTGDVSKEGVIGSPSYATAEKGGRMLSYATEKLTAILRELICFNY